MRLVAIEVSLFLILGAVGLLDGVAALGRKAFQQEPLAPGAYMIAVSAVMCATALIYFASVRWGGKAKGKAGDRADGAAQEKAEVAVQDGVKGVSVSTRGRFTLGTQAQLWAAMLAYALLIPLLGYALATLLFFSAAFYVLAIRPWQKAGLLGLAFASLFVLGFVVLANLLLPSGLVGSLLGLAR